MLLTTQEFPWKISWRMFQPWQNRMRFGKWCDKGKAECRKMLCQISGRGLLRWASLEYIRHVCQNSDEKREREWKRGNWVIQRFWTSKFFSLPELVAVDAKRSSTERKRNICLWQPDDYFWDSIENTWVIYLTYTRTYIVSAQAVGKRGSRGEMTLLTAENL